MKKYISLILILLLTTGCCNVNNSSIENITNTIINSENNNYNHNSKGYKLYIPRGLLSFDVDEYNEIIRSEDANFYLYVDLVSYFNKVKFDFKENPDMYYSKQIKKNDEVLGLLNIINAEDKYFVRLYYGYTKIEVKCNKESLKKVVANSLIIAKSVKYNTDVIESLLNESDLIGAEETVSIFDKSKQDLNALEYDEEYSGEDEFEYDPDEIN